MLELFDTHLQLKQNGIDLNSFSDPTKIYMALPIIFNENVKYYTMGIYHHENSLHFLVISYIHWKKSLKLKIWENVLFPFVTYFII